MVKKFWKFSKTLTSLCLKMVEIFFALFFILFGLLLYRLHNDPIDAMKYIPEIEQALLPSDADYHLQAEKVELTSDWSRDGLIQIDIQNLKVIRGQNALVFSIPKAQFSYDLWHILTLNYLPSSLIVDKPFFEILVDEQGLFSFTTKDNSTEFVDMNVFKKMLTRILAVRELNITGARFHLKDNRVKQQWDLQEANLELTRHFRFSNTAKLNATLMGDGVKSRFLATANFNRFSRLLTLESGLDTINLKKIAFLFPILQEADLDVQLSVKGQFDIAKTHKKITDYISKIHFNAKTLKSGSLNLMDNLDNVYRIQSADINGTLGKGAKTLKIASSKVQLKNEKPADFYLEVVGIDTFLNTRKSDQVKTTLKATLYDVPVGHISSLWPSRQGPDAHAWVKKNISEGQINQANFALYFTEDKLVDLSGDIQATGVRVDYLNPMKPIEKVQAQVLLHPDKVRILANKGSIGDLILEKAELLFTDVDKTESWLQIDLKAGGPVQQALELIASKPLEFTQKFHLKPSMLSGDAQTYVHLSFPLLEKLKADQIEVAVRSDVTAARVNAPLDYLGIENGTVSLNVSNEGLDISGDIMMKNSPLKVSWQEYFEPDTIQSEYTVSGTLMAEDIGALWPKIRPFIKGKMEVDFKGTQNRMHTYSGTLRLDAGEAWVNLLPFAVEKRSENPMNLLISFSDMTRKTGNITWNVLGTLADKTDDLKLTGKANWNSENLYISLSEILAGSNQFVAELNSTSDDCSLTLKGKNWQAYRLGQFLSILPQGKNVQNSKAKNITLEIALDRFALNKTEPFLNLSITGKREGALWKSFHLQGKADDPFVITYNPKKKQFHGSFANLGDLTDRLNFVGRFGGGKISLIADQTKTGVIDGKVTVEKAEFKETGFLLQAVTILGIVDAFRGKDMEFDEIEIPFQLSPDFTLNLHDAFAVGTNLGITFKGQITVSHIDLSGSVVPAYAINSLPGKIPLLGWLFRNSEGGGLINVPYTVTGSLATPELEWSPLKTVAPGALGRLF